MAKLLEPREVEQPAIARWARSATQLFLRSPARFGLAAGLLAGADCYAVNLCRGYIVPKYWVSMLVPLLLSLMSTVLVIVARSADHSESPLDTLKRMAGSRVWRTIVLLGVVGAVMNWLCALTFVGHKSWHTFMAVTWLTANGQLMMLCAEAVYGTSLLLGLFFFPLLTLATNGDALLAWKLSRRGLDLNLNQMKRFLLCAIFFLLIPALLNCLPLFGLPLAIYLVAVNVFAYVAYRDVFEGRAENLPAVRSAGYSWESSAAT